MLHNLLHFKEKRFQLVCDQNSVALHASVQYITKLNETSSLELLSCMLYYNPDLPLA